MHAHCDILAVIMNILSRYARALTIGSLVGTTLLSAGHASADESTPLAFAAPAQSAHSSDTATVTALTPGVVSTPDTATATPSGTDIATVSAPVVGARPLTATPTVIPGQGKRVWFSISAQQVWLVNADGTVARTYLVSGSRYGQLRPGTYSVFSRSTAARSWNSNSRMQFMVRFARGKNAAIGFHSIPRYPNGKFAQTEHQLGLPLSDGCVRQRVTDAKALWDFAPVGTRVIVTK